MGVDLATYRARIGCFQNPAPRSVRCRSQASELLVGVILAKLWEKVMGHGPRKLVRCCYLRMSCLLVWFMACKLLLLAGDIEQNPGPPLRETDPDTDEVEEQSLKPRQNDNGLLELDLSGKNMSSVPNKAFQQNDIQVLNLQHNSIKVIPIDIGVLFQLRHLDISCNKLSHLPDSISSLSNLEELNISENTIQEFPTGMENMQALKVLIYRNNALVTIPDQVFSFPVLEELDVSDNELSKVSPLIGNLLSLKVLNLRWNQSLQTLPQELCQLSNLEELNLSVCDLSCLPDDIGKLRKLKTIKLSCNGITSLPASVFQSLVNLEELDLCDNAITEIPESISNLKKLTSLKVANNQLTRLPASIVELTELQMLNVASNFLYHLKELPKSFTGLVNLTSLNVSSNNLKALPEEMFEFVNLTELNIAGNKIDTLPNTICELQNLEYLSLENNNLRVLPIQFSNLHKLHHFGKEQIQGNPIEQPPIEVFEQGLEGVVAYFEELKLYKSIEVPRVKALLLGEVAAGKTSLCNAIRLGESKLTDITDRTAGIEVHPARLQDSVQVLMHDFGGHEIYHLTHQFFFSTAALFLIVVDLKAFAESSFDADIKYWLNVIKARIDSKPVLRIVATHIDLCDSEERTEKAELIMEKIKQIEKIEVESLQQHLSDIDKALNRTGTSCSDWSHSLEGFDTKSLRKRRKFIEHLIDNRPIFPEHVDLVSCDVSLAGITQLIENIVISCQDHRLFPCRILPKSWFEVELAIKILKQEGHLHYLSMDDIQNVAKEKANMTPTRLTRALKYLHDIGEIVHFADSPKLSDFVFHKPQWLMDVFKLVYKPVDKFDERFASVSDADFDDMVNDFSSRGIVSERMIQCLWKQMNLSKQEESMLICLLQKFDLCFQMPTTENAVSNNVYRFPWLLNDSAPQQFEQCWKQKIHSDEEVLKIVFQLQNYCPVGLFETLSVKLDKYVICRKDWKYGIMAFSVVGENKILVQLESKERCEEIVISVRTKIKELNQAWGDMVLIINATKELLQQWPGVLYCVRVVCPHCLKQGVDKPHRFSGAVLDKAPRGTVVCPKTLEEIDPRLIHPEISPAQWQQKRKRTIEECGKSPAPEEIMMEKQPRYSGPEPGNTVRNSAAVYTTHISKDFHAQNNADTENVWERFRSMSIEMQPGDEGNRLAAHLMESGLTLRPDVPRDGNCLFHAVSDQLVRTGNQRISHSQLRQDVVTYLRQHPYNGQGDHLCKFVPNEDWEGYLQGMSQNGVWGDHIVLQAFSSMLGRDIRIVSSIDADNYTTILTPMGNQQDTTGPPLLLGHYAENHYASLDVCQRCAVLLVSDEYGTSKGGISTINQQLAQLLRRFGAVVYCTVLWVTTEDQEEATKDGVHLISPFVRPGDKRKPSLDWLTYDHHIRFPNLPEDVGYIVGHSGITDKAAENIKNSRYPQAKLFTFNHTIPEDTGHYKGGGKPWKAWDKEMGLVEVAAAADAVFSVGKRIYDHFETMYKGDKKPKAHHLFLPKPSETFENTHVKPGGEQKVVLSIGRVKNVEQLKGHDLAARAIGKAAEEISNVRMRVRGINEDDYETSKRILEEKSGRLKPTLIPYGTQKEISDDMKTAHLVLMPSRAEPFELVGLEALAAGIPVLISSQSGLADLIKELIQTGKCDPDLRHRIVETSVNVGDLDTDAQKWAGRIVDTLRWNVEEFKKAALFKQQLQKSMYWEESHQIFLQACGITNTSDTDELDMYSTTGSSDYIKDQKDFRQTLDMIVRRLDETDLRLLLRVCSARTSTYKRAGIRQAADVMMDMAKNAYIATGDLRVLEKDMIAAGISFTAAVRDIPGVPDEMKQQRTVEAAVGPIGGELEIPGFVKLIVPPGILQQDTMMTISTVDVAAILRDPESFNWTSGYPWSLGEDACSRELLDQVLFSPAVDVNLQGAQLSGPVEVHTWRPPGSEGMRCVLLTHHDGEGWTDITASTTLQFSQDKVSIFLSTFSPEIILWVSVPIAIAAIGMIRALSSRTLELCRFTAYINPSPEDVQFHVVCRDRRVQTDEYLPGFTKCGGNAAMFDLFNGNVLGITVSVRGGQDDSEEMTLQSKHCCDKYGQNVQMLLDRPNGRPVKGKVTVKKVPSNKMACQFIFKEEGETLQSTPPATAHFTKRTSSSPSPDTVPGKERRRSESQQRDDGAGPSGARENTRPTGDVHVYFEKVIDGVSHKWDDLARKLGFNRNEIKGIRTTETSPDHRCREMLDRWRNSEGREAILQVLQQALVDIGERRTAESLRVPNGGSPDPSNVGNGLKNGL